MKKNKIENIILKMGQTENLMPDPKCVVEDSSIIEQIADIDNLEACDRDGRTLLINAAMYGRSGVVSYLIERGSSVKAVDKKAFTALHAAVLNNDVISAKILLDNGADVNAKNVFGNIPLMLCRPNSPSMMFELLLQYGADPFMENNYGVSATGFFAAYPEIMKLLLK